MFNHQLLSLEHRKQRLNLARLSVHADLLKERCTGTGLEFHQIQVADFILYLCSVIQNEDRIWWPETLFLMHGRSGPFEIFARCKSAAYFERVRRLIGVKNKQELEQVVSEAEAQKRRMPRLGHYESLNLRVITGVDQIGTRP